MSTHNIIMFLWRNKKNVIIFRLEKMPYMELCYLINKSVLIIHVICKAGTINRIIT